MSIDAVKEVRSRTGVSIGECKKALDVSDNNIENAIIFLQKKGVLKASSMSAKLASEGLLVSYIHCDRIGVLVEINCSTDFCARSSEFKKFCDDVVMQIAAMNPSYISSCDIPVDVVTNQSDIFRSQILEEGKPEKSLSKILDGKLTKWKSEVCLLDQESLSDPEKTIEELRVSLSAKLGENVVIRRFVRWELGEYSK
jgi:elongation factor Ts